MFDKAESKAPENGYINYYNASITSKFSEPSAEFPERDEILREIRAGNKKIYVNFFFPPPVPAFADVYWQPILREEIPTAVYIDHWNQFSMHDTQDIANMVTRLSSTMSWPEDKDDIGELMVMLYQLGRTQPYDRSFFSLQLRLLNPFSESVANGSDDALELADILRYLNDQYQTVGNRLYTSGEISDPAKVGAVGIHETELRYAHRRKLADVIQRHHKAFLPACG